MLSIRSYFALTSVLALLVSSTPPAQQPPASAASSNRISLDVLALDSFGHPVRGLNQQDFTVLDNGKQQDITGFKAVNPAGDPNALHVVIVVDMINTDFNVIANEREQLTEFLNQDGGKLQYPTALAVMTEGGLNMMKGLTTDGHVLLESFQKFRTDLRAESRAAGLYGAADRLEWSLGQINQIAGFEATRPGRKMVLVIGPGWPMLAAASWQESNNQRGWVLNTIVQTTNALQRAHMSLYSLNPYLLGQSNPFFYQAYLKPVKDLKQADYPRLALQVFAQHSGGAALMQGQDVVGELRSAMRDAGPYYELTYEAQAGDKANEYHELRVMVRRKDVTARTSSSYYANPQPLGRTTPAQGNLKPAARVK